VLKGKDRSGERQTGQGGKQADPARPLGIYKLALIAPVDRGKEVAVAPTPTMELGAVFAAA
jgi:hypothetical protein